MTHFKLISAEIVASRYTRNQGKDLATTETSLALADPETVFGRGQRLGRVYNTSEQDKLHGSIAFMIRDLAKINRSGESVGIHRISMMIAPGLKTCLLKVGELDRFCSLIKDNDQVEDSLDVAVDNGIELTKKDIVDLGRMITGGILNALEAFDKNEKELPIVEAIVDLLIKLGTVLRSDSKTVMNILKALAAIDHLVKRYVLLESRWIDKGVHLLGLFGKQCAKSVTGSGPNNAGFTDSLLVGWCVSYALEIMSQDKKGFESMCKSNDVHDAVIDLGTKISEINTDLLDDESKETCTKLVKNIVVILSKMSQEESVKSRFKALGNLRGFLSSLSLRGDYEILQGEAYRKLNSIVSSATTTDRCPAVVISRSWDSRWADDDRELEVSASTRGDAMRAAGAPVWELSCMIGSGCFSSAPESENKCRVTGMEAGGWRQMPSFLSGLQDLVEDDWPLEDEEKTDGFMHVEDVLTENWDDLDPEKDVKVGGSGQEDPDGKTADKTVSDEGIGLDIFSSEWDEDKA